MKKMEQHIQFGQYILQRADVLVVKRNDLPLFDHYLVYRGNGNFIASMKEGITRMTIEDLQRFSGSYTVTRMRQFVGTDQQREEAMFRAEQCLHPNYSLLFSNCEHFADFVQNGKRTSLQSAKAGFGMISLGAMLASNSKNEGAQVLGGLSLVAGVITLLNEVAAQNKPPFTTILN